MSVDITQVLKECGVGPFLPDSHFEGRYSYLELNYNDWLNERPRIIMDALIELEPLIGQTAVLELMEQVMFRVMNGRNAVGAFLRAVFGEAGVNRQKE